MGCVVKQDAAVGLAHQARGHVHHAADRRVFHAQRRADRAAVHVARGDAERTLQVTPLEFVLYLYSSCKRTVRVVEVGEVRHTPAGNQHAALVIYIELS